MIVIKTGLLLYTFFVGTRQRLAIRLVTITSAVKEVQVKLLIASLIKKLLTRGPASSRSLSGYLKNISLRPIRTPYKHFAHSFIKCTHLVLMKRRQILHFKYFLNYISINPPFIVSELEIYLHTFENAYGTTD